MRKMLILRGTRGFLPDEQGKNRNWDKGALHEQAALEYARRRDFEGKVLDISGDSNNGDRATAPQTLLAEKTFRGDASIKGFYGFSGGGYDVYWVLQALKDQEECIKRIDLVVVLGAEKRPSAHLEKAAYKGAHWELVYRKDPLTSAPFVPKGLKDAHMFGPEGLLWELDHPKKKP
jgi:hypothetical protein